MGLLPRRGCPRSDNKSMPAAHSHSSVFRTGVFPASGVRPARFGSIARSAIIFYRAGVIGSTNGIVNSLQLSAGENHPTDAHHRNQSGDEAIFDGCCAGSISEKLSDKPFHFTSPLSVRITQPHAANCLLTAFALRPPMRLLCRKGSLVPGVRQAETAPPIARRFQRPQQLRTSQGRRTDQ